MKKQTKIKEKIKDLEDRIAFAEACMHDPDYGRFVSDKGERIARKHLAKLKKELARLRKKR
ncbi:MAG: hypothetical protein NT011_13535 [Kiritimatiellaeota bacterium]|nr:hypothetical protein [Kiritimatiellota bacterium]